MTHRSFLTLDVAIEAAAEAMLLVDRVNKRYADLADQVTRAAARAPLAIAEGSGRTGRDQTHHWRIAYSTCLEATTGLQLLARCRAIDRDKAAHAIAELDRVQAMLYRLLTR